MKRLIGQKVVVVLPDNRFIIGEVKDYNNSILAIFVDEATSTETIGQNTGVHLNCIKKIHKII